MKKLKKLSKYIPLYAAGWRRYFLAMLFGIAMCVILRQFDSSDRHVPLIFVLVSLIVSLITEGYFYGILTAVTGVIVANYAFTFPYITLDFSLSGYPLTFLTMLTVSVVVCTLATRLKETERLRRESENEKVRANLLRAISHDIRTPLTGISGAISAVLDEDTENEEQSRELLKEAKNDAEWLRGMVENLLLITKITDQPAGKINKNEEVLEEIFAEVISKFKRYYPDVKVSVAVPDEVLFVPMDAVLIQQVITNLLMNAVHHGEHTDRIWIDAKKLGDEVKISVADNGKGIDKDLVDNIFDGTKKFSKDTAVDRNRNLGIGLSVCKTIVEAHGGEIHAGNRDEGGACFEFSLPLEESYEEH